MRLSWHIIVWALISFGIISTAATAHAQQAIEATLLERIEHAQQRLRDTGQRVEGQRRGLVQQVRAMEQEVSELRAQSAAAVRANDERTLSLHRIESRLQQWDQQANYQRGLMSRYLQSQGMAYEAVNGLDFDALLAHFEQAVEQTLKDSQLQWQTREVTHHDGRVLDQPVLALGPVFLVYGDTPATSGLAQRESIDANLQLQYVYQPRAYHSLTDIYRTGQGEVVVDPSLGRAASANAGRGGVIEHLRRGGFWLLPIFIAAFVAFSMALVKAWQLLRLPALEPLQMSNHDYHNTYQYELVTLVNAAPRLSDAEDQVFAALQHMKYQLHKGLSVVAVVATIAPLLGLLGTVSGMIKTFDMMAAFGTSDADVVSGGIGEALVTTELGLIVAIPALVLSALLSRRARNYYQRLQNFALSAVAARERHNECVSEG